MTVKVAPVIFAFLLSTISVFATPTPNTKISFIENNLEIAKSQALQEGKLIMVDFWATWCSPCRWMDEQTFSRPEVANYLNDKYIPVRVDIDNFDGIAYKNQYNVRFLPTILILDANGKVVKKYEESMAPSKLLKVLKEHDADKMLTYTQTNTSTKSRFTKKKKVKPAPKRKYNAVTTGNSYNTLNNNTSRKKDNNNTNRATYQASTVSNPVPDNRNLAKESTNNRVNNRYSNSANFKQAPRTGHSVQVGAFYSYESAVTEVAKFKRAFAEEVFVHTSRLNGRTCYKVLLGHYRNYEAATKDKIIMKEAGIKDAFVKDLATF